MAYKDLRASLVSSKDIAASAEARRMAEIQQIFFEIAVEQGLADAEYMPEGSRPEDHSVIVYDKFTLHRN